MTKIWYKKYGWRVNPFSIKPNHRLIGFEKAKENLVNYSQGGNICFLNGYAGTGKTSLLRWLELNMRKHTVIYIDAEGLSKDFDLELYLRQHRSLWRKFFKRYPKDVILILDEAQASKYDLRNALKIYWEYNHIKSLVIAQKRDIKNLSESIRDRIGRRIIRLGKMDEKKAFELIDLRTGGKNPFTVEAIDLVCKKAKFVPRRILETCELICIELAKRGGKRKNIGSKEVRFVLG